MIIILIVLKVVENNFFVIEVYSVIEFFCFCLAIYLAKNLARKKSGNINKLGFDIKLLKQKYKRKKIITTCSLIIYIITVILFIFLMGVSLHVKSVLFMLGNFLFGYTYYIYTVENDLK